MPGRHRPMVYRPHMTELREAVARILTETSMAHRISKTGAGLASGSVDDEV
jgi:hypothetical protein